VIPFRINEDWNVISRTIVPIVDQHVPLLGDGGQTGIGDVTQSLFFSPSQPTAAGVIWGIGPAILIPSDTDYVSAKKWGLGPTAVVLRQHGPWTYGFLTNHIWSFGGSGAEELSNTFMQLFLSYTTKDAWTATLQTESTYDWRHSQWTAPVTAQVAKIVKIGGLPVNLGAGVRYYADSPVTGPHGWGARLIVTFVFPKK
ncbi:MAG: transporter, partial [Deltaproteobacteria bacterium]